MSSVTSCVGGGCLSALLACMRLEGDNGPVPIRAFQCGQWHFSYSTYSFLFFYNSKAAMCVAL
jgi:hypothetical protein